MNPKNKLPYWSCVIIASVYSAANRPGWALVWIGLAVLYAVLDYVANDKPPYA